MTYATLMVHLEPGRSNAGVLDVTRHLAERLRARVIGIAARQPMVVTYGAEVVSGELIDEDRAETQKELDAAETEFRTALQMLNGNLEWRSAVTFGPLADYMSRQARSADLVITQGTSTEAVDASRWVNTGDLVMRAGRPVLIVPRATDSPRLDRILVAWKDTREARRAIADALPLLKQAIQVTIVEVAAEAELDAARGRLADIIGWLERHGVSATPLAASSTGGDAARLGALADEHGAQIIVAGAYGHSRLREWVLGGVTRDLLLHKGRCSLLSH